MGGGRRGIAARANSIWVFRVRTQRARARRNSRRAAVWQPDFWALQLPRGAPPFAFTLAVLPRLRGRCRTSGATCGGGGTCTAPPTVSPLRGDPPPPQAGEDRGAKLLVNLADRPEV